MDLVLGQLELKDSIKFNSDARAVHREVNEKIAWEPSTKIFIKINLTRI